MRLRCGVRARRRRAHEHQTQSSGHVPTERPRRWLPDNPAGPSSRGEGQGLRSVAPTHPPPPDSAPLHHPSNKMQPGLAFGFGGTGDCCACHLPVAGAQCGTVALASASRAACTRHPGLLPSSGGVLPSGYRSSLVCARKLKGTDQSRPCTRSQALGVGRAL